jgi:hypothetical protein
MPRLVKDPLPEARARHIDRLISTLATNSLFTESALHLDPTKALRVVPFHAHSLHNVEVPTGDPLVMRPARFNRRHWITFSGAIQELESLLGDPSTRESQIEELLSVTRCSCAG